MIHKYNTIGVRKMKLTELLSHNKLQETFLKKVENISPIIALTETALEHNVSLNDLMELLEVAPPGNKAEKWIKSVKKDFKDRYGDDWQRVLYSTAWKKFGESFINESTTIELLNQDLAPYPVGLVDKFRDESTFSGFISDNRQIGRIVKKLMDAYEYKPGPIMRVAEIIKEYNRANIGTIGNSSKERHAARSDRLLRVRDSSNKATARKF